VVGLGVAVEGAVLVGVGVGVGVGVALAAAVPLAVGEVVVSLGVGVGVSVGVVGDGVEGSPVRVGAVGTVTDGAVGRVTDGRPLGRMPLPPLLPQALSSRPTDSARGTRTAVRRDGMPHSLHARAAAAPRRAPG